MDLKLDPNSHEYARNIDENRVTGAEKKSTSETREAGFVIDWSKRMPWTWQLQNVLYFMGQESTIQCKLKIIPIFIVS